MIKEIAIGVGGTVVGALALWGGTLIGAGQDAQTDADIEAAVTKVLNERAAEDREAIGTVVTAAMLTPDGRSIGAVVQANGHAIATVQGQVEGIKLGLDLLTREPGG